MDISKRLLRRPAATASWLALLLLAALLVQLGFGLIYAAHVLAQKVEALYTTIAVPADYQRRDGRYTVDSLFTDEQIPACPRPTVCCKWICGALPPAGASSFCR